MFAKFTLNNKLNAVLLTYVLSVMFFQPLAITIQVAMIIFMYYRKELRTATYGVILFIVMSIVFLYNLQHKLGSNDWAQTTILVMAVLVNLIWFMAVIKVLKYTLHNNELSEDDSHNN